MAFVVVEQSAACHEWTSLSDRAIAGVPSGFFQALPGCRTVRGIRASDWLLLVAIPAVLIGPGSAGRDGAAWQ